MHAALEAIRRGNVDRLKDLLWQDRDLANARLDGQRTLLHTATDWPGNFPNGAASVLTLIEYGADVNARFGGAHTETALHWAASCDDVAVLDVLLDHGADIDARGAVIGGGTALSDAVAFGQWKAARRLIERGAQAIVMGGRGVGIDGPGSSFLRGPGSGRGSDQCVLVRVPWRAKGNGGISAATRCGFALGRTPGENPTGGGPQEWRAGCGGLA